jgi:hypothetical protein
MLFVPFCNQSNMLLHQANSGLTKRCAEQHSTSCQVKYWYSQRASWRRSSGLDTTTVMRVHIELCQAGCPQIIMSVAFNGERPAVASDTPPQLRRLIRKCWQQVTRGTSSESLLHGDSCSSIWACCWQAWCGRMLRHDVPLSSPHPPQLMNVRQRTSYSYAFLRTQQNLGLHGSPC